MEGILKVSAIRHKDVKGKEIPYLIIADKIYINVGVKTVDAINELLNAEQKGNTQSVEAKGGKK